MSYTPTNWATGDVITAAKLNKLEQGVSESVLVLADSNDGLNKTAGEIMEALKNGCAVYTFMEDDEFIYVNALKTAEYNPNASGVGSQTKYVFRFADAPSVQGDLEYRANSASERPILT